MAKKLYGVWPEGRNTPIVVDANSAPEARKQARKKKAAGAKHKLKTAKKLTGKDEQDARAGRWVRTRADGSRNTNSGSYKYRPQLKKKAKGRKF